MIFKTPWILALIPVVITLVLFLRSRRPSPALRFSAEALVRDAGQSLRLRLLFIPPLLRYAALVLFIVALAGPRLINEETIRKTEGIDIVLTVDTSTSMSAEDFVVGNQRINRLEIVKQVMADFIEQRKSDRIGLVAFAARAWTVTPLTTDYAWLKTNLKRINFGIIKDGTAIGPAIMASISRLQSSTAKSKVVILLTDGADIGTKIDPREAAKVAKSFDVKIYTIGAGSDGQAAVPVSLFGRRVYVPQRVEIDEELLKDVAYTTNGKYYRATDTAQLRKIYEEIDQLEKTEIEEIGYFEYTELFDRFLLGALALLLAEVLVTNSWMMRLP
ncbi:MAG: VWA domain-containing protein [Candidatus Omnitrophica bacterium]|nr:VWA domain-containing protein [Candidatus Omnitrophota bacterium]MCB9721247.1 VWA domain-containing protein [Candidatus Omnitrophota bacterium]